MKHKTAFRLKSTEAAYFAGLLDGEGCITINRSGNYYILAVRIAMKDRDAVEFLASKTEVIGGNVYPKKSAYGPVFQWQLTSGRAVSFLDAIQHHLRVKGKQAKCGIAYQTARDAGGKLTEDHNESFYRRMRDLNEKRKKC